MKAIIFGGIGTIANTSYLQRKSFNAAFEKLSINWHWGELEYKELLVQSGGQDRIDQYNKVHKGLPKDVSPEHVHALKTSLFHEFMKSTTLPLRPGVRWAIEQAKLNNMKIAFATTTSAENIRNLLNSAELDPATFDLICNSTVVDRYKPDPEVYEYCLNTLMLSASNCMAIEDASVGLDAAVAAGINCVAFPNEYTARHGYSKAIEKVENLERAVHLRSFFTT